MGSTTRHQQSREAAVNELSGHARLPGTPGVQQPRCKNPIYLDSAAVQTASHRCEPEHRDRQIPQILEARRLCSGT